MQRIGFIEQADQKSGINDDAFHERSRGTACDTMAEACSPVSRQRAAAGHVPPDCSASDPCARLDTRPNPPAPLGFAFLRCARNTHPAPVRARDRVALKWVALGLSYNDSIVLQRPGSAQLYTSLDTFTESLASRRGLSGRRISGGRYRTGRRAARNPVCTFQMKQSMRLLQSFHDRAPAS
jgi:hypothetical protein